MDGALIGSCHHYTPVRIYASTNMYTRILISSSEAVHETNSRGSMISPWGMKRETLRHFGPATNTYNARDSSKGKESIIGHETILLLHQLTVFNYLSLGGLRRFVIPKKLQGYGFKPEIEKNSIAIRSQYGIEAHFELIAPDYRVRTGRTSLSVPLF